jgi:hypothetical protein
MLQSLQSQPSLYGLSKSDCYLREEREEDKGKERLRRSLDDAAFTIQAFHQNRSSTLDNLCTIETSRLSWRIKHLAYFLKNFVPVPSQNISRSYMGFILPIKKQEAVISKRSTLYTVVKAVSLTFLGNRPNSSSVRTKGCEGIFQGSRYYDERLDTSCGHFLGDFWGRF